MGIPEAGRAVVHERYCFTLGRNDGCHGACPQTPWVADPRDQSMCFMVRAYACSVIRGVHRERAPTLLSILTVLAPRCARRGRFAHRAGGSSQSEGIDDFILGGLPQDIVCKLSKLVLQLARKTAQTQDKESCLSKSSGKPGCQVQRQALPGRCKYQDWQHKEQP